MGIFIQNNSVWLVPCVSIILTILIKIASKPESLSLKMVDIFDFGFDLSISAMIVILTGVTNTLGVWLLFAFFVLVIIASILVSRLGWNKETQMLNWLGVLIPDGVGIFILVIATLYIGGVIK